MGGELRASLSDGVEEGVSRECDGDMHETIDSDEVCDFILHVITISARYRV